MQNKNKFLAMAMSWALLITALAQAETTGSWAWSKIPWPSAWQVKNQEFKYQPAPSNHSPTEALWPIMKFFKSGKDIPEEQKKLFMQYSKSYLDSIKKIIEDKTLASEAKETSIKVANAEFAKLLVSYIDPAKLEEFNKYIAEAWWRPLAKKPWEAQDKDAKKNIPAVNHSPTEALWPIMKFFKSGKDIPEEQKKLFMQYSKSYLDSIKKIIEDKTLASEAKETSIKAANAEFAKLLVSYIDPAKLEEFNKYIAEAWWRPLAKRPTEPQDKNPQEYKKAPVKIKILSQKTRDSLNHKLDALDPAKKEVIFQAIIKRVDSLLANLKSEKAKAQLLEIKELVQSKLTSLNSWEEDIISQVLDWIY
ncbi:MAG: hypothetical protein ACD_3C00183G0004 [uncultured bacterium (gcode 4)]|uniref:DUF5667 domain-containing protein n=1 Tax=uncultured bacterium (gcode 4) TaxID=1234023 RepID=K2F962_9BACT|nr:MAG: hypothetical protein ACD_3C00183G0004 [uncultured bacterium (gcode 4)]